MTSRTASIDIETNYAHDTIWMGYVHLWDTDECIEFRTAEELISLLANVDTIAHWNGIGFDIPVIERVWGVDLSERKQIDGMLLSRLHDPSRASGHSLASYGQQFGYPKGDFKDFDGPGQVVLYQLRVPAGQEHIDEKTGKLSCDVVDRWVDAYAEETEGAWFHRMATYCAQDTRLNTKACQHLMERLTAEKFSEESWELEHQTQVILTAQRYHGFKLDVPYANNLYATLTRRMRNIEAELQEVFQPIVTPRFSDKTGNRLKDGVEVFNVGSRQQIVKRLETLGVKFTKRTPKTEKGGGGNPIVDETTLASIKLPEAQLILEYLILQKREGLVNSWLTAVEEDGRVRCRVIGNGAVTGRMTHSSPNLGQVPGVNYDKKTGEALMGFEGGYGYECRSCWIVDEGKKLVGIDASGLELRMLAHYMKDDNYTQEILNGDVHTANKQAAGLDTRDQAKTFIYAFLYGAGDAKIGSIVGGGKGKGAALKQKFLEGTPALAKLRSTIADIAEKSKSVPGLDGRRIRIRHAHAALNSLLQGAGAVVMKKACVIFQDLLDEKGIEAKWCMMVHDEMQMEVDAHLAEAVGKLGCRAIELAGEAYNMRCALAGEYNVGDSWAETH